jgi:hypothetical protein
MHPVAKRLQCVKGVDPGQMSHSGGHIHSTGEQPFHFCEERYVPMYHVMISEGTEGLRLCSCQNCGYYCTLPLGMELFHQYKPTRIIY